MSEKPNGTNPQSESEEKEPELLTSLTGRTISVYGLVERIIEEFELEHGEGQSDVLRSSTTDVERRKLVRDVAEYIFGIESVQLSPHEQARMIQMAHAEIFGYGPLDDLFADESITTISLEGARKVGLRYAPGSELTIIEPIFDDTPHMQRTIRRLLRHAGAELQDDIAIIETGLIISGRRVSLSVASPPFVPETAVDIRLHPVELPSLDDWIDEDILNEKSRQLLQAIMQSEHGLLIVGDTESGKTTLLSILLRELSGEDVVSVERAGELQLPDGTERLNVQWTYHDQEGISFGEQIRNALESEPQTLVIDEVRNDEPESIAPLLANDTVPRQIWTFRGTSDSKRLASALGMLARMSDGSQSEHMVIRMYERLPFMVVIKRRKGQLQIREIAEWQFPENADNTEGIVYADYVALMAMDWNDCVPTGKRPQRPLDLPDDFWNK